MSNIVPVIRKDKTNRKGLAPINIRVYSNGKVSYVSTGFSIPKDEWDEKKSLVKKSVKDFDLINVELSRKVSEVIESVTALSENLDKMEEIRQRVYGKKKTEFLPYADGVVKEYWQNGKIGTHDNYKAIISKFREFAGKRTIYFQDMTPEFLRTYELYLKDTCENSTNTINRDFRFIRRVFNHAIEKDVIEFKDYSFRKFKLKLEKTEKGYLTEEELRMIQDTPLTEGTRIHLHRDMFIFAVYAGGIRISDLLQLRWGDYDGKSIRFKIDKTGTQVETTLMDKAKEILKKYHNASKADLIFPVIKNPDDLSDPVLKDRAISGATAFINKNLRIIAQKAGITKNVSFHLSRHTFATQALRQGLGIEMVAKILGHQGLKQVMVYAKIADPEKAKAMQNLNF